MSITDFSLYPLQKYYISSMKYRQRAYGFTFNVFLPDPSVFQNYLVLLSLHCNNNLFLSLFRAIMELVYISTKLLLVAFLACLYSG